MRDKAAQGKLVSVKTHPCDHRPGDLANVAVPAVFLTAENVADVNLDRGKAHPGNRVANRDARMCVASGVDQKPVKTAWHPTNPVDDVALVVALAAFQFDAKLQRDPMEARLKLG